MPDFTALEQQYGLPPGLLAAQQQVESGFRDVTSPKGAQGPAQLMPATARSLGVNPHDPDQAARAQAILMRQNLDATGGDLDAAAMMYNAGPNRSHWNNPETQAYPGKIVAALSARNAAPSAPPSQSSSDPFENALAGTSAAHPASNDPFEAALAGGTNGGNGNVSAPLPGGGAGGPGGQAGSGVLGDNRGVPPGGQAPGGGAGGSQASPAPALPDGTAGGGSPGGLAPGAANVGDYYKGLVQGGLYDLPAGAVGLGARATDAIGLTHGALDRVDSTEQAVRQKLVDPLYSDPNDWSRSIGRTMGQIIAGAPLSEVAPLEGLGVAAKLPAIAKYGDMAMQGAGFGAITSGGHDVAKNAAIGALAAPALGAVISKGLPLVMAGAKGIGGPMSKLADAIKARIPDAVPETDPSQWPADPAFLKPDANPAHPGPLSPEEMAQVQAQNPDGLVGEVTGENPAPQLDPAAVKAAMGSRGLNVGIEGSPALPPDVDAHAAALSQQGVPLDQALREARLTSVGASPTVANVTRDPAALRAEVEGSKLDTLEGQALASQRAANNGAVVTNMSDTAAGFSPTGQVPDKGEATISAAQALAKASDAASAKTKAAYAAAKATDPDALITPEALYGVLNSPEARAVPDNTPEGGVLSTVRNAIDLAQRANGSKLMPTGMSPEAFNNIRTMVNRKFGADKAVNYWIKQITGGVDQDLGQVDTLGDAWKAATKAHADWAREFQDPAGVRNLIARDPQGNLLNENAGAANDAIWTKGDSTHAVQVINALKANGANDALGLIKSHVAQQAFQEAGGRNAGNAVDQANNSPISGKAYHTFLNKVGDKRLSALYSPDELAHMANLGHAANILNETPAGINNSANTSSALANAIMRSQTAGQPSKFGKIVTSGLPAVSAIASHLAGAGLEGDGIAGIVAERVAKSVSKAAQVRSQASANAALAEHLRRTMSPEFDRAAANENALSQAERARRIAIANAIATRTAPAAAADRGR